MPIDPSLLLTNLQPLPQLTLPSVARARAVQNQDAELELQARKDAFQREQQVRQILSTSGGQLNEDTLGKIAAVSPEHAARFGQILVQRQQEKRLEQTQQDAEKTRLRSAADADRQQFDKRMLSAFSGPEESRPARIASLANYGRSRGYDVPTTAEEAADNLRRWLTPEQVMTQTNPPQKDIKTREVRKRLPDGSEQIDIVEDKPGFSAVSAPPLPPLVNPLAQRAADRADAALQETLRHNRVVESRPVARGTENVDGLAQTVIDNPALFDQLTATDKGRIAPRLKELGYDGFGKPLAPAAVKQIADTKTAMDSLNDLKQTLKENEQYLGPVAGLSALNPYSDARKAQAKLDLVRQRVGKALEGGVLRKEDEEKYKKILATLTDTPSTAISKVDGLLHSLEQDVQNFIGQQRLSGRRVSQEQVDSVKPKKADPLGIR